MFRLKTLHVANKMMVLYDSMCAVGPASAMSLLLHGIDAHRQLVVSDCAVVLHVARYMIHMAETSTTDR